MRQYLLKLKLTIATMEFVSQTLSFLKFLVCTYVLLWVVRRHRYLLYSALDITANFIWEIQCLALDGFDLNIVHKLSS